MQGKEKQQNWAKFPIWGSIVTSLVPTIFRKSEAQIVENAVAYKKCAMALPQLMCIQV